MKWMVLPYSESYFEETKFEKVYESSINFHPCHMPTFLPDLHLMRPLSLVEIGPSGSEE